MDIKIRISPAFTIILLLMFTILKLVGVLTWNWIYVVLAPIGITILIVLLLIIGAYIYVKVHKWR